MKRSLMACAACVVVCLSCGGGRNSKAGTGGGELRTHAPAHRFTRADVSIEKQLTYDRHTLADTFPYRDGVRVFRFDKMKERIFMLDSVQQRPAAWGILQNRRNEHGRAPLTGRHHTDEYNVESDGYGVERDQSAPLYAVGKTGSLPPERYGRDGSPVKLLGVNADSTAWRVESFNAPGQWEVPVKYVKSIDTSVFEHVVMVDRTNQDIATLERTGQGKWLVRSMNPCTTGEHTPPVAYPTPVGMFVIQDREAKMMYDNGGSAIVGFAPWASRFTNGAFLHGVPVNDPDGAIVEFSATLGTVPRSHECVRNASSHAKFIYDRAPLEGTIVFVYD